MPVEHTGSSSTRRSRRFRSSRSSGYFCRRRRVASTIRGLNALPSHIRGGHAIVAAARGAFFTAFNRAHPAWTILALARLVDAVLRAAKFSESRPLGMMNRAVLASAAAGPAGDFLRAGPHVGRPRVFSRIFAGSCCSAP